jgi:molecular chaperone DnaK
MTSKYSWFGIDFGTTNSAACSFTGLSQDTIIPICYGDDEQRPFPSVIAINKNTGEIITGREAKARRNELIGDHEYFSSIKSVIDSSQTWTIAGKTWAPEDIAAEIFKSLKNRVERGTSNTLDEAVVAVPNGFTAEKKKHLRNAALKAGIKVKMFISEPTAAFCSNYNELKSCNNVAVFDWGGGTLDVTILKVENGNVFEMASSGMQFAGDDIDRKIAQKMHTRFMRTKTPAISFDELDAVTKDRLLSQCERAKCDFEDEDIVSISIMKYGSYGPVRDSIDYDYFSLLLEDDVSNAMNCLEEAIAKAGLNKASLDCILCVGGSSKLRPLKERLYSTYGEDMVYYPDKVMWDIAKGAAISSSRSSTFCSNQEIGVLLSNGELFPILRKGQPLPCIEFETNFAIVDDEKYARFVITDSKYEDKRTFTQNLLHLTRGFLGEHFILKCYVDQDFILKVAIRSSAAYKDKFVVWKYCDLKVYYKIEVR